MVEVIEVPLTDEEMGRLSLLFLSKDYGLLLEVIAAYRDRALASSLEFAVEGVMPHNENARNIAENGFREAHKWNTCIRALRDIETSKIRHKKITSIKQKI